MSIKLRDLIRTIRSCSTAAEERAVIAKECANIRTAFRDEGSTCRHRNVAKLLFMNMLGYSVDFGQMECLKLIASAKFAEKRVGYLGLTQLLDENTEVLMLVTNSIKNDFSDENQFVAGLGICALANVGTAEMCGALTIEIEKLLSSGNPYIRKKAAHCASRVVKKCDEMIEKFVPKVRPLIEDRQHGVSISGLALMNTIILEVPEYAPTFREQLTSVLVRILRNAMNMSGTGGRDSYGNNAEYEVAGVSDPFLQCKVLRVLRTLLNTLTGGSDANGPGNLNNGNGSGNFQVDEEITDILAQIATNTESSSSSSKKTGNAVLYECAKTIMSVPNEPGLHSLAVNILGKFLMSKDSNTRYVALATLQKVIKVDIKAVQRHRQVILDVLRDPDVSMQRRAVAVLSALISTDNIKSVMKELLNFLIVADNEVKEELVTQICRATERWGPNRRWIIDTFVKTMCLGGNYVQEESRAHFCQIVGASQPLHEYCVHKLYFSLQENMNEESLVLCALWVIGEHGDLLISGKATGPDGNPIRVTPTEILDTFENVSQRSQYSDPTKRDTKVLEHLVTALIKLVPRFQDKGNADTEVNRIKQMIGRYETHISAELQQRACEYREMLHPVWNTDRGEVLGKVPAMENKVSNNNRSTDMGSTGMEDLLNSPRGGGSGDGGIGNGSISNMMNNGASNGGNQGGGDDLLDLLGMGGGNNSSGGNTAGGGANINVNNTGTKPGGGSGGDDLLDLLGAGPSSTTTTNNMMSNKTMIGGAPDTGLGGLNFNPSPRKDVNVPAASGGGLDDLLGLGGGSAVSAPAPSGGGLDDLLGLGGSSGPTTTTSSVPSGGGGGLDILGGLGGAGPASSSSGSAKTFTAFSKNGLDIQFSCSKVNPTTTRIQATFKNAQPNPMTDFNFEVAVPKTLQLQMQRASASDLPANNASAVTQMFDIVNTSGNLDMKLAIRTRIRFNLNGKPVQIQDQVDNFPQL